MTIEDDRSVQMHDLIQLMGQDIIKQECPNDPGKRSRLWCYDDVFEVLSGDTVRASHETVDNLIFFNLHAIT